ncbi:hypothetical protein B0A52_03463 [Exophiala mesophila]|uniref:Zn(2)-C6 fungal-type domain-containing protein n=1 Tax=Exophiala mesophila TaxID=212818 RepID=A0A438N5R6_EXOME|nr:hypothetical protein B0A52_03463 [Exophiala mesophila]
MTDSNEANLHVQSEPPKSPSASQSAGARTRTACKHCNARRVKCDVMQQKPCWQCRTRNVPCELISSKRGKYVRGPNPKGKTDSASSRTGNVTKTQYTARSTDNHTVTTTTTTTNEKETLGQVDGPEMLFARMTEPELLAQNANAVPDQARMLFFGEALPMGFIINTICSLDGRLPIVRLHHPVPAKVPEFPISHLNQDDIERLRAVGALDLPEKEIRDELIRNFFQYIYPGFPVLDRIGFAEQYQKGQSSLLLLQTLFFLATTVCDESLLARAGLPDRLHARQTFYKRAKALYDADYEQDQVTLTSVLFLLSFWWAYPEDQKDSWFWLGAAISLAQSLGLHRTTAQSNLSSKRTSLWRRIWWSIYTRDRHIASSLGRPSRIRDEDCDVLMLTEEDFRDQHPSSVQAELVGTQEPYHVSYFIELVRLAFLLGRVLSIGYTPGRAWDDEASKLLAADFQQWQCALPLDMFQKPFKEPTEPGFWACMLHLSYHNALILFCRPRTIESVTRQDSEGEITVRSSADAVARLSEDLLSSATLRYAQLHIIPTLFGALSIHSLVILCRQPISSQLAENRARLCMLALSELSKLWPAAGWILRVFDKVLRRLTGHDRCFECSPPSGKPYGSRPQSSGPIARLSDHSTLRSGEGTSDVASNGLDSLMSPTLHSLRGSTGATESQTVGSPLGIMPEDCWAQELNFEAFENIFQDSLTGEFAPYGDWAGLACHQPASDSTHP